MKRVLLVFAIAVFFGTGVGTLAGALVEIAAHRPLCPSPLGSGVADPTLHEEWRPGEIPYIDPSPRERAL